MSMYGAGAGEDPPVADYNEPGPDQELPSLEEIYAMAEARIAEDGGVDDQELVAFKDHIMKVQAMAQQRMAQMRGQVAPEQDMGGEEPAWSQGSEPAEGFDQAGGQPAY